MRLRTTTTLVACLLSGACEPMTVIDNLGARGRVLNRTTQSPIERAKVCPKMTERAQCTYTNANGEFDLLAVTHAEWMFTMVPMRPFIRGDIFTVEATGYAPIEMKSSLDNQPITIFLIPK